MSRSGRRGVAGSGSALTGAQPTRISICGNCSPPNTSSRRASRVSAISNGSVMGQLARPVCGGGEQHQTCCLSGVVADPFQRRRRCRGQVSMHRRPWMRRAAVPVPCRRTRDSGTTAVGLDSGVLRAGTPAVDAYLPLHVVNSVR